MANDREGEDPFVGEINEFFEAEPGLGGHQVAVGLEGSPTG